MRTPSGEEILSLLDRASARGLTLTELSTALGQEGGRARLLLQARLAELVRSGVLTRQGRAYARSVEKHAADVAELDRGEAAQVGLLRVTPQGRGFVDLGVVEGEVLLEADDLGPALDGDTVTVETWKGSRRLEGRVVQVLRHGRTRLTGTLRSGAGGDQTLEPDDPRLARAAELVTPCLPALARPGDAVLAEIVEYPRHRGAPVRVRVSRRLGEPGRLLTEVARALAGAGVEETFPVEVLGEAEALPRVVRAVDLEGRSDLRQLPFVTIDPQTARDFDDAVAVEEGPTGSHRVYIAVADVSSYVLEGSDLDQEARRRGCSLYLPDRAIPMLPPTLSAEIGSLVPGADRLALVVELLVTADGEVPSSVIRPAVIHSHGRLDYAGVAAALEGDFRGQRAPYLEHAGQLEALASVASALRSRRLGRGSLDLDLPEAEVILDEDDPERVRGIVQSRPDAPIKRAYGLIEELMIVANEAVGRFFQTRGRDTLWRVHAAPGPEPLERLAHLARSYGVVADGEELATRGGLARLLARLRGHRAGRSLCYQVLRTLKQASYGTVNVGHYGLASETYLHFTSPIRRYPDLHVHRLVKDLLGLGQSGRRWAAQDQREELQAIARQASLAERRAIEVEREVTSLYAASLMRDRIGDVIPGTIAGVTAFGFFVSLDEPYVEGLVRLERLKDWFELDAGGLRLHGRDSGQVFSLGDRVEVKVMGTNLCRRQVDLELLVGEGSHEADPALSQGEREPQPRGRPRSSPEARRQGGPRSARGKGERGSRRSAPGRSGRSRR